MKAKKRPTLDFTRIAPEGIVPRFEPAPDQRPDAPPVVEAELEIVEAPAVEMAAEPSADLTPPTPETRVRPAAEAPFPPAVIGGLPRVKEQSSVAIWVGASLVSALWAAAPVAYAFGYRQGVVPLQSDPLAMTVFALLVVGPLALIWIAAYLMRQGQRLSSDIRLTRELAQTMVGPAALAAAESGAAVELIRQQIDAAAASASEARETMLALRQALAEETERLAEEAAGAERTSMTLAEALGRQRESLGALSGELDSRAAAVSDSISMQARMVAEASDLAETQLREAEAALAARAADLAAAAGEASDAARVAGEDLARQVARLETAGVGVGDQMRIVEAGLSEQRASLVTVSHAIRADQEDFAAQAETRAAQLTEFMTQATMSASNLGETAAKGGEALRDLIGEAAAQMQALLETAAAERETLTGEAQSALSLLTDAAAGERARLERELREAVDRLTRAANEAREAAEGHAEAAQSRVDQLSEAAFNAHQQADAVFQARLEEARDLIETSAQMVEQAGARTAGRLEEGAASARTTLAELQALLTDLENRTRDLPEKARAQTEEVKAAMDRGMGDLMETARRTAEETQAIDNAFQERVRRNYDMLTDAVKLMGVVAGAAGQTPSSPATPPPASLRSREISGDPAPSRESGLRPRLRLTPTATDEEFRSVFETAGGRAPAEAAPEGEGNWSWKDLLSSIDGDSSDAEGLAERLLGEIEAMGIDPSALLPRGRIDEIAAAIQTRDQQGAREVVRRLAPAAIRRLIRRLFSDASLRGQTERYLRRFSGMLDEAAERDRGGLLVASLLSSDAGRAWLLLDAAAGDLA
ncbi:MAG: polar localization protein TipN [Caulobacter sp.]|nr:polar localization protein TipN [Caulobacter sp.]